MIASSRYVAYNAAKQSRSSMDNGFSDLPMAAMRTIDPRRIEVLDEAVVEVLRAKTVAERVAMAFDAERTMRLMLEADRGAASGVPLLGNSLADVRNHGAYLVTGCAVFIASKVTELLLP